ncbi:MAG: hypothetical protein WBC24_00935, partial [Methylovirgula sp.]
LGELTAWGRLDRNKPLKPIGAPEWDHLQILFDDQALQNKNACAWTDSNVSNRIQYIMIQFSQQEMLTAYPVE